MIILTPSGFALGVLSLFSGLGSDSGGGTLSNVAY